MDDIKTTALKLFANKGYEGTSMGNIAAEVGIRKASIYSHIKSKEELYILVLDYVLTWDRNYFTELLANFPDISAKEKFHLIFLHYSKIYQEEPYRTNIMFLNRTMLFPPEFIKKDLQQIFDHSEALYNPILVKIIKEGISAHLIKDMKLSQILTFFYCTIDGLFVEACYYSSDVYRERLNTIWLLFWQAIKY